MPILVDSGAHPSRESKKHPRDKPLLQFADPGWHGLTLGLINNMPDLALEGTERQFIKLLEAAAEDICVRLELYSLPNLPRSDWGRTYLSNGYSDLDDLWDSHLDALIVTGTEPRASDLRDEPYWAKLTQIISWAEQNTISTIWSCLAAHAAVFHIDGISRVPLGDKCFGIFEFARTSDHLILRDAPVRWRSPHSRWNGLQESALISSGYSILAKSPEVGIDTFVKETRSLFIFFQGHPEYTEDTLLREYRRDIARFLRGERETFPNMPLGYFDDKAADLLDTFQKRALANRSEHLLAAFPDTMPALDSTNNWGSRATQMYRNWLAYVFAQKRGNR
jgi:homoserine O-succinyltransferase